MKRFKVGDKVEVVNAGSHYFCSTGTITEIDTKEGEIFPYYVDFGDEFPIYFEEHELKLVEKDENQCSNDEQNMNILEWNEKKYPFRIIHQTSDRKYVILFGNWPSNKETIIYKNSSRLKVFGSNQKVSLDYLKQICENDHLEDMKKQPTCDFPTFPITLNFFFEYPKVQNEQKIDKESTSDEHDFKIGDRVLIVDTKVSDCAKNYIELAKNLVGTITKIDKTQKFPYYVEFERVVLDDDRVLVFCKHELKLIENQCSNDEQKMDTEPTSDEQNMFKIGDHVQIANKKLTEHGCVGMIIDADYRPGWCKVLLDYYTGFSEYKQSSLKLVQNNENNQTHFEHPFFNLFQQLENSEPSHNDEQTKIQKLNFWQRIHEIFEQCYDCDLSKDLVKIENHLKIK